MKFLGYSLKSYFDVAENGSYAPIDFRSLSVREFGTDLGLLESELSIAEERY